MKKVQYTSKEADGSCLLVLMKQHPYLQQVPIEQREMKSATVMKKWIQPKNCLSKEAEKDQEKILKAWNYLQWAIRDSLENEESLKEKNLNQQGLQSL